MSTAAEVRLKLAEQREQAEEAAGPRYECHCGNSVDPDTFNRLGRRCAHCYGRFCAFPPPAPSNCDIRRDSRDWAYALKEREEAGARLTQFQRDAWRAALKNRATTEDETP